MPQLRSYLYLDQVMVNDFLASVEGTIHHDEKVVQTREKGGSISGEGGASLFKVGGKSEAKDKTEITKQVVHTDAGRFQRLYNYLEAEEELQYFSTMSPETWEGITRHDILELDVTLNLSRVQGIMDMAAQFANISTFMENVTGSSMVDSETEQALNGLKMIGALDAGKGIPVTMTLLGAPDYSFVAFLAPGCLRVEKERLTGEATVLCKVQRKLSPGEKVDLFQPFGGLQALNLNRTQRRNMPKPPPELTDSVKGPGAVVLPVGIYR